MFTFKFQRRTLLLVFVLLVGSALSLSGQDRGGLKKVYRSNEVELQDDQGQVVLWVDAWARVHSPEIRLWQKEYNSFVHQSFRSFIGAGLSAPEGIELLSPQPSGHRGIRGDGVFAIPTQVAENGVLTRDTLSLVFFRLGIQWNYRANYLKSDCQEAATVQPGLECNTYTVTWQSSQDKPDPPLHDDPLLLGLRYSALQKALASLRQIQAQLGTVVMVSAEGNHADGSGDDDAYGVRLQECLQRSLTNMCWMEVEDVRFPLDWQTAQVDASRLTPEFLESLHQMEREVQLSILTADAYREVTREGIEKLKHVVR